MAEARFEWDPKKDLENQEKHEVSFAEAQFAFADRNRVIAADEPHSVAEERYYCFGRIGEGVLTVRFTYREDVIRVFLVRAIGVKANKSMSAKIKYTDESLGSPKVVPDFLPRPEDLAFQDEGVKITIALSKRSVEFFKTEAQKHNTQYQRMIRRLLDAYADHHSRPLTAGSRRTQKRAA